MEYLETAAAYLAYGAITIAVLLAGAYFVLFFVYEHLKKLVNDAKEDFVGRILLPILWGLFILHGIMGVGYFVVKLIEMIA